ncbi:hypothetical protein CFAM422_003334 [Trichoderma lentiforme]|uniref:Uncharacterized protein n=1 Tax=Trichoderma lentiforme TaxID=1567552 RepID=A0A9P5CHB6_9HYPO|nr:hypothetical protein CFAM422_003334 [Trichoderma lentiforme]
MRNFTPECTLPPNGTYSGYVHGVNTRSTLEIVWSCIGIIILSTWSILHLDLPADIVTNGTGEWLCKHIYLLWRKVFWMGLKLFSPEFAATGCARKIFATRSNSAMLERLAHLDGVPWSLKHTILVDMGGIALRFLPPKDGETSTPDQATQRILPDNEIRPGFIKDFCRRQNRLLKWCGKIPWDLWECHVNHAFDMEKGIKPLARAEPQKELAFSEADAAALAGNIWILDSKQLAIARKKGIISKMPEIKEEAIDDKSKSDGLVKIIAVLQVLWLVVQLIVRTIDNLHFTQLEITTVAFAATAVIIYSIDFIKPKDVNVPFYIDVRKVVVYSDFVAIAEAAPFAYMQGKRYYMPTSTLHDIIDYRDEDMISGDNPHDRGCEICSQWKSFIDSKRSKNDKCSWRNPYKLSPSAADIFSLMIGFASATSFGGVHLFAWNSDFPTDVERLLWRISALMTIVLPYIYIATHIPYIGSTVADIRKQMKLPMNIVLGCIAICYIPCRLFLVTESFRALYYLPSEAFKATPAVMSIPHMG